MEPDCVFQKRPCDRVKSYRVTVQVELDLRCLSRLNHRFLNAPLSQQLQVSVPMCYCVTSFF